MINRKQLSTIFYIYGNASVAVLMGVFCILELLCGLVLTGEFSVLCYSAAALFACITYALSYRVYRSAKTNRII